MVNFWVAQSPLGNPESPAKTSTPFTETAIFARRADLLSSDIPRQHRILSLNEQKPTTVADAGTKFEPRFNECRIGDTSGVAGIRPGNQRVAPWAFYLAGPPLPGASGIFVGPASPHNNWSGVKISEPSLVLGCISGSDANQSPIKGRNRSHRLWPPGLEPCW